MRFFIFVIVIGGVLVGAYFYLIRDRGVDPVHQAFCEDLRKELANGNYLEVGEYNFSYADRVRLIGKGCL
jgi:hypothetical protein